MLFGIIALVLGVYGYGTYFRGIFLGTTKPHSFSWFVRAILASIVFWAQRTEGGGRGALTTLLMAIASFFIAATGLKYRQENISLSDWIMFVMSLAAIPLWIVTEDPLWSVILVTVIDTIAFIPAMRKTYISPYSESLPQYCTAVVKVILAIFALEAVTFATYIYPVSLVVMNALFVAMVWWRRKSIVEA